MSWCAWANEATLFASGDSQTMARLVPCAPFALLQACLGLEIDAASSTVVLRRPRLPQFLDWLSVRGLRVGESTLDLMFRRHDSSVAVNLVRREGDAEVEVLL